MLCCCINMADCDVCICRGSGQSKFSIKIRYRPKLGSNIFESFELGFEHETAFWHIGYKNSQTVHAFGPANFKRRTYCIYFIYHGNKIAGLEYAEHKSNPFLIRDCRHSKIHLSYPTSIHKSSMALDKLCESTTLQHSARLNWPALSSGMNSTYHPALSEITLTPTNSTSVWWRKSHLGIIPCIKSPPLWLN